MYLVITAQFGADVFGPYESEGAALRDARDFAVQYERTADQPNAQVIDRLRWGTWASLDEYYSQQGKGYRLFLVPTVKAPGIAASYQIDRC